MSILNGQLTNRLIEGARLSFSKCNSSVNLNHSSMFSLKTQSARDICPAIKQVPHKPHPAKKKAKKGGDKKRNCNGIT